MNQYQWPTHGHITSRLIYGCMTLGSAHVAEDRAFAALDAATEAGITAFDHADIYAGGASETVFGRWLAEHRELREDILIQSKCGIRPGDPVMYDFSRNHIVTSVEGILSRLGIEYLDVLLLHRPDPLVEPEEVADAFDYLFRSGKVRSFGVSNHSPLQIEHLRAVLDHELVANQLEISLAHPDIITAGTAVNQREPAMVMRAGEVIDYCRLNSITLQAWGPLAQGKYSGDETNAPASVVTEIAQRYGVSREAIVLGWIMRHPAPILPVIGTTNPARIAACAEADTVILDRTDWFRLLQAARGTGMP
ncbi:MAG: aldo/keto reductase [Alkalispirochaeta sp.]